MLKAVDVECGYMHSLIIALDGTIHMCGGVGTDGSSDGQSMREIADGAEVGKLMSCLYRNVLISKYSMIPFHSVNFPKDVHHKYQTS
jgi:alpha-tubulin suppressor-like RCC1 family protein